MSNIKIFLWSLVPFASTYLRLILTQFEVSATPFLSFIIFQVWPWVVVCFWAFTGYFMAKKKCLFWKSMLLTHAGGMMGLALMCLPVGGGVAFLSVILSYFTTDFLSLVYKVARPFGGINIIIGTIIAILLMMGVFSAGYFGYGKIKKIREKKAEAEPRQ